ncbi:MAG: hypothetical protein SVT52_07590 [Planctomycetota bacterium]|nr:hypothetical protein [Planctomycetota bacterium]
MIYNHSSQTKNEVDILITFNIGAREYRTVIECRDRRRRAGPGWIRDLRTKRDDCGLDKIVAVHATGFSDPALREASSHEIEVITLGSGKPTDWLSAVYPFMMVELTGVPLLETHLVTPFRVSAPVNVEQSTVRFPRGKTMSFQDARTSLREAIKEYFEPKPKQIGECPESKDEEYQFTFSAPFQDGTNVVFPNGETTRVLAINGRAVVRRITSIHKRGTAFDYKGTQVCDIPGDVTGRNSHLTFTGNLKTADTPHFNVVPAKKIPRHLLDGSITIHVDCFHDDQGTS